MKNDINEMIKTENGFEIFCNAPLHVVEGKSVALVTIWPNRAWLEEYNDLENWEGDEDSYDGCLPVYWDDDNEVWMNDDTGEQWNDDDAASFLDNTWFNSHGTFAIATDKDVDFLKFASDHGISNKRVTFEYSCQHTQNYTWTSGDGVPLYDDQGDVMCWINPA